mmetsp:Transcript_11477/g.35360  ORF Transcript_11477/g.35360 Transcript_11477/m.35360 type:complete len:331 (-) Transcript_11477:309-1301(-)
MPTQAQWNQRSQVPHETISPTFWPPNGHPGTQKTSASASRRRFGARCPRRLSSKRSSAATTSACPKHSAHSLAFRARCPGRTGAPTNPFGCDPRRSGFAPRCRRYSTVRASPSAAADMSGDMLRSLDALGSARHFSQSSRTHWNVCTGVKRASATTACRNVQPAEPRSSTASGAQSRNTLRSAAGDGFLHASKRARASSALDRRRAQRSANASLPERRFRTEARPRFFRGDDASALRAPRSGRASAVQTSSRAESSRHTPQHEPRSRTRKYSSSAIARSSGTRSSTIARLGTVSPRRRARAAATTRRSSMGGASAPRRPPHPRRSAPLER